MKDIYDFLNISKDVSDKELTILYENKKNELKEKMFLEGEEGNKAARDLTELKNLYNIKMQDQQEESQEIWYEIERLVNDQKIDLAQEKLNSFDVHNGLWHYYQALIYYRSNWFNESRKQIVIALSLEPNNTKFKGVLDRLDMMMLNNSNATANIQDKTNNNGDNNNNNQIIAPCGGKDNSCCKLK